MFSWRLITVPLKILLSIIILSVLWVLIAYRDIPVVDLEKKYGGENLSRYEVDGVNFAYKVEGQTIGTAPAIVLLHSHFWTMRLWQPWVDHLSQNYTVVRFDLTSHGLTGPDPTQDYSRKRQVFLLKNLLDHIGIDKFTIVGSSSGGAISFNYAAMYPDQVESLVMINTPGMPKITNKAMERGGSLPSWGWVIFYLMPEGAFRGFLESPVYDKSIITDEVLTEFHEMYRGPGNRYAEYQRMNAYEREDPREMLKNVTAPTLIMWGEKNPQLPVESVDMFEERLINAKVVEKRIYPDVGHIIPLEIPKQSVVDLEDFLVSQLSVKE